MRTIGLIGGMSWRSTAFYYAAIHAHAAEAEGGDNGVPIVLWSVRHHDLYSALRADDRSRAAKLIVAAANGVVAGGAGCVAVACNSAHMFADDISAATPAEFIDIRDVVGLAVLRAGYHRVGLLATSFTAGHGLYDRLVERGFARDVVVPEPDDQRWLDTLIFDRLCTGSARNEDAHTFAALIDRLAARGADVAVLGCTELNLLGVTGSAVSVLDSAAAHARALADWSAGSG